MVRVEPKEVIVEFLTARLTDPRGLRKKMSNANALTTGSQSFNGDASTTTFTISSNTNNVYAITSVVVDGSTLKKWQDYTFDPSFQSKVVTFTTAPASGTSNVVISWKEGATSTSGNWIYSNLYRKRTNSTEANRSIEYPRMNLNVIPGIQTRLGRETSDPASTYMTERYSISAWTKEKQFFTISGRTYEGDKMALLLIRQVQEAFTDFVDDLYPKLKHYTGLGGQDAQWNSEDQVFQAIYDFELSGENLGE